MGMPIVTADDLSALRIGLNGVQPATVTGLTPAIGTPPEKFWGKVPVRLGFGFVVIALVIVFSWLITMGWGSSTAPPREAVDGLGIFAVFFVAALAVERLIEPLTLLDRKKPKLEEEAKEKEKDAVNAVRMLNTTGQTLDTQAQLQTAANNQLGELANAKAATEIWSTYRTLGLWGVASVVGALAAAVLNLHLLKAAGIQTPNLTLEILATGLIIGAGTKPLHELNKLVTVKKS